MNSRYKKPSESQADKQALVATNTWAAIDLGSNSFHLLLARPTGASFIVEERLKEKVQLLAGFSDGQIQPDAQARGLACLARFAQRLSGMDPCLIRVMGTCALRQANNSAEFAEAAEKILRVPLDIISGRYEAELIYGAVAHQISHRTRPRLVLDIGGGSTEFAVGVGRQAIAAQSVDVGCVAFKDQYFGPSILQAVGYEAAKKVAVATLSKQLLNSTLAQTLSSWQDVELFGTSGTIESIQTVLSANGWAREAITVEGVQRLENAIIEDRWVIEAGLPGLAPDRTDIFPAGVAILSACFEVLGVQCLEHVDVSLLHGIICDAQLENLQSNEENPLTIDEQQPDLRDECVALLAQRFAVDMQQAKRVGSCASRFFQQSDAWWDGDQELSDLLRWAASLHEVGVQISARHYHRHGAYIVKHAQLPGFSHHQQSILSLLIRGHRRSLPGLAFQAFDPQLAQQLLRLVALLRLAVILERSHNDSDSPLAEVSVDGSQLRLECGDGWLLSHPLSARELEVEQAQQAAAGILLSYA